MAHQVNLSTPGQGRVTPLAIAWSTVLALTWRIGLGLWLFVLWGNGQSIVLAAEQKAPAPAREVLFPAALHCPNFAKEGEVEGHAARLAKALPNALQQMRLVHLHVRCLENNGLLEKAEALRRLALAKGIGNHALHRLGLARLLAQKNRFAVAAAELSAFTLAPNAHWHRSAVYHWLYGLAQEAARKKPKQSQAVLHLAEVYFAQQAPRDRHQPLLQALLHLARREGDRAAEKQLALWIWRSPFTLQDAKLGTRLIHRWPLGKNVRLADVYQRIRALFRLRLYKSVVAETEELKARGRLPLLGKKQHANRLGRYYLRSLMRMKHYSKARRVLSNPAWRKAFQFSLPTSQFWQVRIALNGGHLKQAKRRFARLERKSPRAKWIPSLRLRLARAHRSRGQWKAFYRQVNILLKKFPASVQAAEGCWEAAWSAYRRKNPKAALAWLKRGLSKSRLWEPIYRARFVYWQGRILAEQGKQSQAKKLWQRLQKQHPYNFYAVMANYALKPPLNPYAVEKPRPLQLQRNTAFPQLDALLASPRFQRALLLLSLNLGHEADAALSEALRQPLSKPMVKQALALFDAMEMHHHLIRLLANKRWGELLSSNIENTALWRRSHPLAHLHLAAQYGQIHGVDPLLALSIMREESRFDEDVRSPVGALGLMQLMPATARHVGRRINIDHRVQDLVYPQVNVPLGVAYLGGLLKRFKHNLVFAAAAYNAGPSRVKRWRKQFGDAPIDVFIERIPYKETRNYVRRVWLSYWVYQRLYRP